MKYYRDRTGRLVKAQKPLAYKIFLISISLGLWFTIALNA